MRSVSVALVAGALLTSACAVNSSGCDNLRSNSRPLAVGETVEIEVRIIGDRADSLDVHGGYYEVARTVTLRSAAPVVSPRTTQGLVRREAAGLSLVVDGQAVPLEGPLRCE